MIYNDNEIPDQLCKQSEKFPFDINKLKIVTIHHKISPGALLHFGDIDSDSYPDLLTIVTTNDFRKVGFYKNVNKDDGRQF